MHTIDITPEALKSPEGQARVHAAAQKLSEAVSRMAHAAAEFRSLLGDCRSIAEVHALDAEVLARPHADWRQAADEFARSFVVPR